MSKVWEIGGNVRKQNGEAAGRKTRRQRQGPGAEARPQRQGHRLLLQRTQNGFPVHCLYVQFSCLLLASLDTRYALCTGSYTYRPAGTHMLLRRSRVACPVVEPMNHRSPWSSFPVPQAYSIALRPAQRRAPLVYSAIVTVLNKLGTRQGAFAAVTQLLLCLKADSLCPPSFPPEKSTVTG